MRRAAYSNTVATMRIAVLGFWNGFLAGVELPLWYCSPSCDSAPSVLGRISHCDCEGRSSFS